MVSTSDHSFFFLNLKNKKFLFLFLFFIILISCVLVVVPCLTFQSRKVSWFSLQNNSRCQRHKDYLSSFRFSKRRPRLPTCYLPLVVLSFRKAKKKKKKKKGNFTQKTRKHIHTCERKRPNINSGHFIPCDPITFPR